MRRKKTFGLIICPIFSCLIAVGAFIRVPISLPFTMQLFFVVVSGIFLGAKRGAVSCFVYAALGLFGLPIFAEGGGFAYIFNPSFGYIIGFIPAAAVVGAVAEKIKASFLNFFFACLAGMGIIYLAGMTYYYIICNFYLGSPISFELLFFRCFLFLAPGDIASCALAALLAVKLKPKIKTEL